MFRTYRQSDRGDEEAVARERIEQAKVYLEAVDQYDVRDIEAAARALLNGSAPGVNPAFIPPAPVVAAEVRRQMNLRVDRENLDKRLHPALPAPDIERTPESRARVADLVRRAAANLASPPDEDPKERHRRRIAKTNERFDRDPWFEVGDPEDSADAA